MDKLYRLLRILLGAVIGIFIGGSAYSYYHYMKYPELYAMQSTPWYTGIQINAIFTTITVVVLLIVIHILKTKMK